jgi:hypothetical protein
MSEWLKEHAWKLNPLARADAHQTPPTHFRFNDFRNINTRQRVPVTEAVRQGLRGVSDTVLTQSRTVFTRVRVDTLWYSLSVMLGIEPDKF